VRIGGAKIIDADEEVKHAVALAKDSDQVIICAGLNVGPLVLTFIACY
jgi:beta-glucosidase